SKLTREQLIKKAQEQIAFCRHTKITGEGLAHVNQCAALFEIALAAMDSEPVAEVLSNRPGNDTSIVDVALPVGTQLYLHAQPEPVVPDGYVMVPKEPTDEMLAAAKEWTGLTSTAEVVYIKMLAAAPQEVKSES
ncbi:TPA: hypothetical protein ACGTY9_004749, partial [Klebsiella pneumoniae]